MQQIGHINNQHGFSILEVIFGVIMLSIMLVGMSQLLVTGFQQQDYDSRDILAKIAINNVAERLRTQFKDNYGTSSEGGGTYGGCSNYAHTTTTADYIFPANFTTLTSLPPASPALFTKCPGCVVEAVLDCDDANNVWNGYIRMRTAIGGTTIASIPFDLMQPGS